MEDENIKELLRLTRENNEMLQELVAYVRKVDSTEFQNVADMKEFSMNVIADILVEVMDMPRKKRIEQDVRNAFSIKSK